MSLIHIRLNFEYECGELLIERIDYLLACNSRQGRHGHFKEAFEERLNAEVVQRRAEEHGAELSVAYFVNIELISRSVKKLDIVRKCLTELRSDKLIKLFRFVKCTLNCLNSVLTTMEFIKCKNFTFFTVIDSFKVTAAADGPVYRICADAEFLLKLFHKVVRTACLTVELIDKSKDGNIAHCAYFKKLACLRLDALCCIDYHNCAVSSHECTVGVLGEVLVTWSVKDIDAVTVILKLHYRRAYGYTTLLLKLHPVGNCMACSCLAFYGACKLYCSAVKKELFCKGCFTCVRMRDNRKSPATLYFVYKFSHILYSN